MKRASCLPVRKASSLHLNRLMPLHVAVEEAKKAKEEGKEKVILFNLSGHGLLDLGAYDKYFAGDVTNLHLSDEEINKAKEAFKAYPKPAHLKSF